MNIYCISPKSVSMFFGHRGNNKNVMKEEDIKVRGKIIFFPNACSCWKTGRSKAKAIALDTMEEGSTPTKKLSRR